MSIVPDPGKAERERNNQRQIENDERGLKAVNQHLERQVKEGKMTAETAEQFREVMTVFVEARRSNDLKSLLGSIFGANLNNPSPHDYELGELDLNRKLLK